MRTYHAYLLNVPEREVGKAELMCRRTVGIVNGLQASPTRCFTNGAGWQGEFARDPLARPAPGRLPRPKPATIPPISQTNMAIVCDSIFDALKEMGVELPSAFPEELDIDYDNADEDQYDLLLRGNSHSALIYGILLSRFCTSATISMSPGPALEPAAQAGQGREPDRGRDRSRTAGLGRGSRNHGLTTMFLLRNLNAVHYRKSLTVRISAKDGVLESVVVQGGPWTPSHLPAETHKTATGEYLDVSFGEVPSDAVFIIRTHVSGGVVRLERSPDSKLKLRRGALDAPIPVFTLGRALRYFLPRWTIGILIFFALFVGSVWIGPDRMTVGDSTICILDPAISRGGE